MDSANINDLPREMITEMFSYLNISDIKVVSLVCKYWYDLHQNPKILDRMILSLDNSNYDEYKTVINKRKFYNIHFFNIHLYDCYDYLNIWQDLGPNLKYIRLRDCSFTTTQLISILQTTQNLKSLNLEYCNFINPIKYTSEFNSIKDKLKNITKFKFEILIEDNVKLFNILIDMMPNLKSLETDDSFYLEHAEAIYNSINNRKQTLQSIAISVNLPSEFVECITNIENLKLKKLNVNTNLSPALVKSIITKQKSITDFFITSSAKDGSDLISSICSNLQNIKQLSLKYSVGFTDESIQHLWQLKQLKSFEMTQCEISAKGLMEGLKDTNDNLRKLTLKFDSSCENLLSHISNKFHNLTELEVCCTSGITDMEVKSIWMNLRRLRSLSISCDTSILSDFAFTDYPFLEEQKTIGYEYPISNVKGLQNLGFYTQCDITVATIEEISKLKELMSLNLNFGSRIELNDLETLVKCQSIETICVEFPIEKIIYNSKELIKKFTRIKRFNILQDNYHSRWWNDD